MKLIIKLPDLTRDYDFEKFISLALTGLVEALLKEMKGKTRWKGQKQKAKIRVTIISFLLLEVKKRHRRISNKMASEILRGVKQRQEAKNIVTTLVEIFGPRTSNLGKKTKIKEKEKRK
jgi:hypothetical protein